ncbi:hypothetical protein BDQ17DRAFT_1404495 [Cyathus striatus]|nr:hypothetical protein BDQ17DRAFT_1404495 [Cyathus striatus]
MSTSCVTSATATRTDVLTTFSLSTSLSTSVSIAADSTSVTVISTCTNAPNATGSCTPVESTSTLVIPGFTTTIEETLTVSVPVISTSLETLQGTSCTVIPTSNPGNTGNTGNSGNSANNQSDTSSSTSTSTTPIFTPPPTSSTSTSTFVSSSSSTLPGGGVTVVPVTVVSTMVLAPTSSSTAESGQSSTTGSDVGSSNGSTDNSNSPKLAPIIGGVVGGFFGLIAIVLLIWFIIKRRKRWDDIFEKDDDMFLANVARQSRTNLDLVAEPKPKPYEYGLVGHAAAPTVGSPPGSPPPRPASFIGDHSRNNSLAPLVAGGMGMGMAAANMPGANSTPSLSSARPSSAGVPPPFVTFQLNERTKMSPDLLRAGSPVSVQEQRILQVTNASLESPDGGMFPDTSAVRVDGKGRPVNARGEKVPLVHLDGGRLQEGSSSSAPAPPPEYTG